MRPDEVPKGIYTAKTEDQAALKKISHELDLQFFKDIAAKPETPYNTTDRTEKEFSCGKMTRAMYTALIDLMPLDPSTMIKTMIEAKRFIQLMGRTHANFFDDQQL